MTINYKCKRCDKLFNNKTDYTRHQNRVNICKKNKKINGEITDEKNGEI